MTTLLFLWVGKVFIPNHLSLFQINYNYGGFLGDMVSCREHSPIPPKCTDGCGVRLPQFHTSAAAKTINSWQVLLNHGNMRSLLKQMRQNLWGATPEGSSQRDAVVLRRFSTDPFGVDGATLGQLAFLAPLWRDTNRFWRCRRAGKRRLLPSVLVWEGTRSDVSTQLLQQSLCVIPNYFGEFRQGLTALLPGWRGLACGQPHCRGWRGCLQSLAGLFQDSKTTPIQVLKWSSESQLYF